MEKKIEIVDLSAFPSAIPTLAKWHYQQWGYLNPKKTTEKRIELLTQHLKSNVIPSTFIAIQDEKVIGSASLVESDMDDRLNLTPWLASVYVAPEYRNKGIGTKLVKKVMELASENSNEELYLYTPDKENFYKKISWRTIEKREYHNENITMMKLAMKK